MTDDKQSKPDTSQKGQSREVTEGQIRNDVQKARLDKFGNRGRIGQQDPLLGVVSAEPVTGNTPPDTPPPTAPAVSAEPATPPKGDS